MNALLRRRNSFSAREVDRSLQKNRRIVQHLAQSLVLFDAHSCRQLNDAIVLRTNDVSLVLHCAEQCVRIGLSIHHVHHADLRRHEFSNDRHLFAPAKTLIFVVVADFSGCALALAAHPPNEMRHRQQSQWLPRAVGGDREREVAEESAASISLERSQPGPSRLFAEVELRRVVNRQHRGCRLATLNRGRDMRRQDPFWGHPIVVEETVRAFKSRFAAQRLGQALRRPRGQGVNHLAQAPCQAQVSKVSRHHLRRQRLQQTS